MAFLKLALLACALGNSGDIVLLDFTATWCGPCRQMEPVVHQLQAQGFPIQQIDIDQQPQLAQQFRVTGVPCFVLVAGGREVKRVEGATDAATLVGMFQAVNPAGGAGSEVARGQSPDPATNMLASTGAPPVFGTPPAGAAPATFPSPASPGMAPAAVQPPASTMPAAATPSAAVPGSGMPRVATGESDPALATMVDQAALARMMEATVRIRIGDGRGNSVGTGTIIDARDGEALVLTCGHIFRDSQGQGDILIDMFAPGAPQGSKATMIGYDLESDVGLISFRPSVPVRPCPVERDPNAVRVGDVVVSVGCNHGEPPTPRVSKVTSIDKFLGPSNLQVAGQPVQGRSGGGLFDARGNLIGVCNAADPEDNEGLYAALKSIHAQFQKLDLAELLLGNPPSATPTPMPTSTPVAAAPIAAPPSMPRDMPQPGESAAAVVPVGFNAPATNGGSMTDSEVAMLEELRKRAGDAEIICIVRSLSDPQAKSEIIVLDRASPEFIRQLATLPNSVPTNRQETSHRTP